MLTAWFAGNCGLSVKEMATIFLEAVMEYTNRSHAGYLSLTTVHVVIQKHAMVQEYASVMLPFLHSYEKPGFWSKWGGKAMGKLHSTIHV